MNTERHAADAIRVAGKPAKMVWFRTILTVETIYRCHEFKEGWEDKAKAGKKDVYKREDETPRIEESGSVVLVRGYVLLTNRVTGTMRQSMIPMEPAWRKYAFYFSYFETI